MKKTIVIISKEKLECKAVLIMIILFSLFLGCTEKEIDFYKTTQLKQGLPDALKPIEKDVPFKNFSYASLDTGTDTLQVFFGSFFQGTSKGHWFAIESNGQPAHFSTVSLEKVDTLDYPSKDIDIEFNNDRNRLALRIIQLDSLNYKYSWLDNYALTKRLAIKSIEKPLRINTQFPEMNLEFLDGEYLSSSNFKGQFVVTNWWASWCGPCIKEIPGLNEIVDKYSDQENVRFIAITDDPKKRITSFLKSKDFNYEMTFADLETRNFFGNSYPVNIIIDPTGKITFLKKGAGPQTPSEIDFSLMQQLESHKSQKIVMTE